MLLCLCALISAVRCVLPVQTQPEQVHVSYPGERSLLMTDSCLSKRLGLHSDEFVQYENNLQNKDRWVSTEALQLLCDFFIPMIDTHVLALVSVILLYAQLSGISYLI